jgi:hypothetical protein
MTWSSPANLTRAGTPVLAGLVISLLAGPALIARVWKAQLQYWQDLRETELP